MDFTLSSEIEALRLKARAFVAETGVADERGGHLVRRKRWG
jgi:hypothetical protein